MKLTLILLFLLLSQVSGELFTIGATFLAGAVISYFYSNSDSFGDQAKSLVCKSGVAYYGDKYIECCNDPWVEPDISGLRYDLENYLFGQHIAKEMIPSAIAASRKEISPSKPLVMSFHGWPGNGKNYVASFIAKNYFQHGADSNYFHLFSGRKDFSVERDVNLYKRQLSNWVRGNVTLCKYSVFVFDEVDKMPFQVLDILKPFLDHHNHYQRVDYRRSIFIFLSNTGGNLITERYLELWRKYGKSREQMTLNDFDSVIGRGAFNEEGGLQKSELIEHNLIDHYIPFLPLEKSHVEMCIKAELDKHGFGHKKEIFDEVMQVVTFGPKPENLFSSAGCKRVSQQVATIVERERFRSRYRSKEL
ncbi:torsin-1A [Planococcus citri]|uniref:torsin-1A n=1 Tax=Planococcus citri TaxID=170843 RepID=UPI0031FA0C8D